MKKSFGLYLFSWIATFGLFNLVTFITPSRMGENYKYDVLFWISYAVITLTYIGQLACAYIMLSKKNAQKTFYGLSAFKMNNISLYNINIVSLVIMTVVSVICMAIIPIPEWIGIIICCCILAYNVVAIVNANTVINAVYDIDQKIKVKTLFIKMLTADAEVLFKSTTNQDMLPITKKIYESVRYSDPMSNDALVHIEDKISEQFTVVSKSVDEGNLDVATVEAEKFYRLINERNAKCKVLK